MTREQLDGLDSLRGLGETELRALAQQDLDSQSCGCDKRRRAR